MWLSSRREVCEPILWPDERLFITAGSRLALPTRPALASDLLGDFLLFQNRMSARIYLSNYMKGLHLYAQVKSRGHIGILQLISPHIVTYPHIKSINTRSSNTKLHNIVGFFMIKTPWLTIYRTPFECHYISR